MPKCLLKASLPCAVLLARRRVRRTGARTPGGGAESADIQRLISLEDRISDCFLRSMNGAPPPFDSREMMAASAYIA
jgi:hypothetical protein